jgi:hypothetical protein
MLRGFGGLDVACWPLIPKLAGSNPAETVGFFKAKKSSAPPSFGGEDVECYVEVGHFQAKFIAHFSPM